MLNKNLWKLFIKLLGLLYIIFTFAFTVWKNMRISYNLENLLCFHALIVKQKFLIV